MNFKNLVLPFSILALSACSDITGPDLTGGQYWQRASASEAIYQQGPKVQQMLDRDIARCVTEMRELERLDAVKDAIPTDPTGKILEPDEKEMSKIDVPDHDASLLAERSDYHDFEACMISKGWERVKYVPFEVAERARKNFYKANVNYEDPRLKAEEDKNQNSTEQKSYRSLNN